MTIDTGGKGADSTWLSVPLTTTTTMTPIGIKPLLLHRILHIVHHWDWLFDHPGLVNDLLHRLLNFVVNHLATDTTDWGLLYRRSLEFSSGARAAPKHATVCTTF